MEVRKTCAFTFSSGESSSNGMAVQRRQRSRPVGQPRLLRRGIDSGKAVALTCASGLIAAARQLLLPPVPLFRIEGAEPRVGGAGAALRLGRGRHEHEDGA